jgi:hypothetical protein
MNAKHFDNVKDQIGYCGLWCGSCIVGNGALRELTRRYEALIKGYGVDKWGAKDFDAQKFLKGLKGIQSIAVCRGCLKGGGNEACRIRPCASARKVSDCEECGRRRKCRNHEARMKVRAGARKVGMLMKTGKGSAAALTRKWRAAIRGTFPSIVIED